MIATRKTGGLIIPQRTMTQIFLSAANGMFSLLSEKTRIGFIDSLEKGIIQEEVLSQATSGPMMMLSLFHDLQNPLFKKYNFVPSEFLQGLVPALENFHNVSSALENELHEITQGALSDKFVKTTQDSTDISGAVTKVEKESLLSALRMMAESDELKSKKEKVAEAILNHEWVNEAKRHPDSLAAQLSRMVTKELFQINQLSSKTAFLLQNQSKDIVFCEGSCQVNNVALLSARASSFKGENGLFSEDRSDINGANKEYGGVEPNFQNNFHESDTEVAAQLEVLYDVTQEFVIRKPSLLDSNEMKGQLDVGSVSSGFERSSLEDQRSTQTTIVSVVTIEGWLHGGPDGELRWKLASYRPPYEFPRIKHAYKY